MAEKPEGLAPPSGTVQAVKDSSCKSSLEPPARCFPCQNLIILFFFFNLETFCFQKKQITVEQHQRKCKSSKGVLPFQSTVMVFLKKVNFNFSMSEDEVFHLVSSQINVIDNYVHIFKKHFLNPILKD